jgi:uncharacterized membrane protein
MPEKEKLTPEQEKEDIEKNKDVAALSYLWILSVVVLDARRDSPFVQYHARQGFRLFLISIPIWMIPKVGRYIEFLVLAGMIIGFLSAAQGRRHEVPLIGKVASGEMTLRDIWRSLVGGLLHAFDVLRRGVTPQKAGGGGVKKEAKEEKEVKEVKEVMDVKEERGERKGDSPEDEGTEDPVVAAGQQARYRLHPEQEPQNPIQPPVQIAGDDIAQAELKPVPRAPEKNEPVDQSAEPDWLPPR